MCPIVKGERICEDKIRSVSHKMIDLLQSILTYFLISFAKFVQEIPVEKCHLSPRKVCRMATKIVPTLVSNRTCLQV